jgi:hypothetical protein
MTKRAVVLTLVPCAMRQQIESIKLVVTLPKRVKTTKAVVDV